MKDKLILSISLLVVIGLAICGIVFTNPLSTNQFETLKILGIICGASALYCFIAGELSRNNSQMDKLWSFFLLHMFGLSQAWVE